jgi:hypothetical protein
MRNEKAAAGACQFEPMEARICFSETMSGAAVMNMTSGSATVTGAINKINTDDFYCIHVTKAATVNLKLSGLSGDATLELIQDRNNNDRFDSGETVVRSNQLGTVNETISHLLDPGTYFVRVSQATTNVNTKYTLQASNQVFATPDQKDTVGDDIKHAMTIAPTKNSMTITEYIGGKDPADWYHWDVKSPTAANIRLDGLVYDADVTLIYDRNHNGKVDAGETIATTVGKAFSNKLIAGNLAAGSYFLEVVAKSPAKPTTYSLRIVPSGTSSYLKTLT